MCCAAELVGVLTVGTWTLVDPSAFPDATVWSDYGMGYLFIPVLLPVTGLMLAAQGRATVRRVPPDGCGRRPATVTAGSRAGSPGRRAPGRPGGVTAVVRVGAAPSPGRSRSGRQLTWLGAHRRVAVAAVQPQVALAAVAR